MHSSTTEIKTSLEETIELRRSARKKKRTIIITVASISVFLILAVVYVASLLGGKTEDQEHESWAVELGSLQETIEVTGSFSVENTSEVNSMVTGTVANVGVKEGSHVNSGDVLFEISSMEIQNSLLQANNNLKNAKTNLANQEEKLRKAREEQIRLSQELDQAVADYNHAMQNHQNDPHNTTAPNFPNSDDLKAATSTVASLEAQVESTKLPVVEAQLQVDAATKNLEKCSVRAPLSGTVSRVDIQVGDNITSFGSPAIQIVDLSKMQIELDISENQIKSVKSGLAAYIKVEALDDIDEIKGTVTSVSVAPTSSNEGADAVSYKAIIVPEGIDSRVKIGMRANVKIVTAEYDNVLLFPKQSVKTSDGKSFVYPLSEDGTYQELEVEVIASDKTNSAIKCNLSPGSKVVLDARSLVKGS